jgi:hypothetical protein
VRFMVPASEPHARLDLVRAASEALTVPTVPDAHVLAAVQDGLESVAAGSPTSWFDVPTQRGSRALGQLGRRRGE